MENRKLILMGFIICALSSIWASKAYSWGDLGHGAVGHIAEYKLTPKGKSLIFKILGPDPLAIAAIWPDQVRSDKRYSGFAPFHFLEIPMGKTFADLKMADRAPRDADTIISKAPLLLADPKVSRDQKMILLRYLVHIVGDVHQPLHIGNGQDRGANLCDIQWVNPENGKTETSNLHSFWDDKMMRFVEEDFRKTARKGAWFGYRELGDMILQDQQLAETVDFKKVSKEAPSVWYTESQELHPTVYPDPAGFAKPEDRAYCKLTQGNNVSDGAYDASKIPTITDAYVKKALPIIKKRILMAGYRLAGVINQIAEKVPAVANLADAEANLFNASLLSNTTGTRTPDQHKKK